MVPMAVEKPYSGCYAKRCCSKNNEFHSPWCFGDYARASRLGSRKDARSQAHYCRQTFWAETPSDFDHSVSERTVYCSRGVSWGR